MSHNKFFSPSRFLRLLRHDWFIHRKMYLFVLLGLLIGVYALSYFLILLDNKSAFPMMRNNFLVLLFVITIPVFVGNAFPYLRDHIKSSNYLLLPGSIFEKILVQFVMRILLFIPLVLGILSMGSHLAKVSIGSDEGKVVHLVSDSFDKKYLKKDNRGTLILESIEINFNSSRIPDFNLAETFDGMNFFRQPYYDLGYDSWNILFFISFLFSFVVIFFAGSVCFKNLPLIKTLVCILMLFGVFLLTISMFQYLFFGFGNLSRVKSELINQNIGLYFVILSIITVPFFLVFTYFRLKEKEL